MSVKIMCSFEKDGELSVSEIEPVEILWELTKIASKAQTLEEFSKEVQSGGFEPECLMAALLWDRFNTCKIADAVMSGLLQTFEEMNGNGGRNDN